MKKLFSILMALVLFLGLGSVAFAATTVPQLVFQKDYIIEWSGTNPTETIGFTITPLEVTDSTATIVPPFVPNTFDITVAEGINPTNSANIPFPTYSNVGIYYYTITETAGDKAGVTYDEDPQILQVVVVEVSAGVFEPLYYNIIDRDIVNEETTETKGPGIRNTFNASSLIITKTVTGNLGDKSKYFDVVVTFTLPEGKTMGSTILYTGGQYDTDVAVSGLTATISMKHGDTVTFSNIPDGVTYTVVENAYSDYATSYLFSDADKMIDSEEADTAAITNDKNAPPDTGISLDSIPYILLLTGAIAGMSVLFFKKRRNVF